MMALNFLSSKLPNWVEWLERMRPLFSDSSYPLPDSKPKFIGEIIQRFNVRKGKATSQAAIPIDKIKTLIKETFIPSMAQHGMLFPDDAYEEAKMPEDYCISEIRDFQGMIHKSYYIGKPVFDLTDEEIRMPIENGAPTVGNLLENYIKMRDDFASDFKKIANQLIVFKKYADRI